jgi:tRNA(Ile)-lysidine synthase
MSTLTSRVSRTIRRRELFGDGDRVAAAVSGGPDSVGMTWVLRDLEGTARWRLVGLIHVNHRLRSDESDADERFCRDLADRLGLPIVVKAADVRERARERHQSIEAAARIERYASFEQGAIELDATRVATGHTRDDQAETVLLRLFRGASSRGLSAIRPRRGIYVRPLIDVSRDELRADLGSRGETAREDSSNNDLAIPRNRLRRSVLPAIVGDWPGAVAALARFAELAADDEQFLAATAREVSSAVALPAAGGVQQIDGRGLNQLPGALARRIVRQALEAAGAAPSFRDVEAVRALARSRKTMGHLDLDGLEIEKAGSVLRFGRGESMVGPRAFEYALDVPGVVTVAETGATIRASMKRGPAVRPIVGEPESVAVLQAEAVTLPLTVRSRRPGDRLRPLGAPGSRKLQDLFVDRKVPGIARDRVPLVVDQSGRIVWVVGHVIADECRVTRPESGMVILELKGNL